MKFLTEQQGRAFLIAAKTHRLYPLFAMALGSEMRQGELLGLQWPDVDFDKGAVDVKRSLAWVNNEPLLKEPKSKAGRRLIALPKFASDALREHRTAALQGGLIAAPVFCTRNGTHLMKRNLGRLMKPLLKRTNAMEKDRAANMGNEQPYTLPEGIRFHDLRHSHASGLIAAGNSIKAVSRRLGHADIVVTLRVYSHLLPNDDAKLAVSVETLFG